MKGQGGGGILVRLQSLATIHEETPMLATLPESRARRSRSLGGTIASLLVHATLVAAAVALTMTRPAGAAASPEVPPPHLVIYRPASDRAAGPSGPRASTRPSDAPPPRLPSLPAIPLPGVPNPTVTDWSPSVLIADPAGVGGRGGLAGAGAVTGPGGLGAPDGVADEHEVDRSPALAGSPPVPRYPDALRAAGITGTVVTEFVVDTAGRAEPGSLVVLEATRPEFAQAVAAVLPRFRFTPGELAGRRVRTRVRMPFAFTLR